MRSIHLRKKWLFLALSAFSLIIGGAFLLRTRPEPSRRLSLWRFTENGVFTEIQVAEYASGRMKLLGTFTPTREHFHLYSKDLPKGGLNGLGRPTLLEVVSSDGIKSVGSLAANQPTRNLYIDILRTSFPVYPEGPVTLSFFFELASKDNSASMELSVTYMACSDAKCLPPVIDKRLFVKIPNRILQQQ